MSNTPRKQRKVWKLREVFLTLCYYCLLLCQRKIISCRPKGKEGHALLRLGEHNCNWQWGSTVILVRNHGCMGMSSEWFWNCSFTSAFKIARNLLKKKRKEEQVSNSQWLRRPKAPSPTKRRIKSNGKGEKIEKQQINIIFLILNVWNKFI